MFQDSLNQVLDQKNSLLCVGLDTDIARIPDFLLAETDPLFIFNREIIAATHPYAAAYKLNLAFYEALGIPGWELLERTLQMIPRDCLVIADGKRGDIGNSSRKYAETYFITYPFHAITVSPYMGYDSLLPFLEYPEKGVFILCLTSNEGAKDFQMTPEHNTPLYLQVAGKAMEWQAIHGNCGLVVGATHEQHLKEIRETAPTLPFLIPGIGAQGGDLANAVQWGTDVSGKLALINASRSIIYASSERDFAEAAGEQARVLRNRINHLREKFKKMSSG